MTGSPIDWYAARAAGVVAYVLLTGGVLLGTTLSGRVRLPRWPAFAVTDVHRFVAILVGVFLSIHVAAIGLDTYKPFSLTQLVVPGASTYRPLWVALGIVAAELLVAIAVTNLLRRRLGFRLWRRVHYLTFVVWAGATAHGLGAGTDTRADWLRLLYVASIASVLAAVAWRVARVRAPGADVAQVAAAATVFAFVLVLGLGKLPRAIGSTPAARAASPAPASAIADSLGGSIQQQRGSGGELVSVVARGSGERRLLLRIDLVTPDGQTIADTSLQVKDVRTGAICTGTVQTVGATGFRGTCAFPGGASRAVSGTWTISQSQQSVSGRLRLAG